MFGHLWVDGTRKRPRIPGFGFRGLRAGKVGDLDRRTPGADARNIADVRVADHGVARREREGAVGGAQRPQHRPSAAHRAPSLRERRWLRERA